MSGELPDFCFPDELAAFRRGLREQLAGWMSEGTDADRDGRDLTGWSERFESSVLRKAGAAGLLGVSLPVEHGGQGRPRSFQAVVSHEAAYHDAPLIDTAVALVAPTVIQFGSPAQKDAFLPPAIAGTINAAIAYTEAGAGSDLAEITTTAFPDEHGADGEPTAFVIDGEKVLVTGPHKAHWCLTIARTEPGTVRNQGLSMLLVPMSTPGVEVERVRTANGWDLGTIRFNGAIVGAEALLGERSRGWRQLGAALLNERSGMAWLGWARRNLEALVELARGTRDPTVRDELASLVTRFWLGMRFAERVLWAQDVGGAPVVESASVKVWATELLQGIARSGSRLLGPDVLAAPGWFAQPPLGRWFAYEAVERLHPTLSVGANEIQRTTIAQLGLGLPREPG